MQALPSPRPFWLAAVLAAAVTGVGLAAAHFMETRGHVVTGMGNEVVWGVPHVFAIFMIVAASGVLNMASVGSVFGQPAYKARAKLSGLLSLAGRQGPPAADRQSEVRVAIDEVREVVSAMAPFDGNLATMLVNLRPQLERRLALVGVLP